MATFPVEKFSGIFWTANLTELLERAAYYSMASFVVIYLGWLGFGAYWRSNLYSVLWTLVYFLPILSGTVADFNDIVAKGVTKRLDGVLDLDPTQNALGQMILTAVGPGSAFSMWLFNHWLEKQKT